MIKVAIIDDHAVMRMGMKYALGADGEMELVGELESGEGAVEFIREKKPDVLLLDIYMPSKDGLAVLEEILAAEPEQKVLMLTTSAADNDAYRSLQLGAHGYFLKDRDANDIFNAIRIVAAGGKYVPPAVQELLKEHEESAKLTEREIETVEMMAKGLSNEGIGEILGISLSTVKMHVKSIFDKLDVRERVSAVNEAKRRGYVRG